MKKSIFLIIIIYSTGVFCQTFEPTQQKFNWRNSSQKYLSADSAYFMQDKFLLGWHWGGTPQFTSKMKMNQKNDWEATRSNREKQLIIY